MAINRTIQFKRNQTIAQNAAAAKNGIIALSSSLQNGEFVIGSYMDSNARNGVAEILGIKAQGQLFFIDNQVILNKLGINDDGTVNENITDSVEKLVDRIINGSGLNANGTYAADTTDKVLSGATSLANADDKLSDEIQRVESFIGMDGEGGDSIVDRIAAISGKAVTDVEDTATIDFTKEDAIDGTKKIKADVKISEVDGNVILAKADGIYAEVDYDEATNSLVVNGVKKALNAGSIVDNITYDPDTEDLIITYHTTTSSEEQEVRVNMADLIEEYDFVVPTDDAHNVAFTVTRHVGGKTTVQADVQAFDCGEY